MSESAVDTSGPAHAGEEHSPFQGLGFYTEADAKWFFGRMAERKIILAHLRTARLTLLYAESGVGKSSLLRAGVAARLRELAAQNPRAHRPPRYIPVVFSAWKDEPVADLIAEIETQVRAVAPDSKSNGAPPQTNLAAAIRAAASRVNATLVIILDQFEEHFSYRLAAHQPEHLAEQLAECINAPDVPANFLIAVREDAYGRLGDLFAGRISNVYSNYLHLEYLKRAAAREAIENPVDIYNAAHAPSEEIALDQDLADAVLDEVRRGNLQLGGRRPDRETTGSWSGAGDDQIETPFLQLVMTRLWECERAQGSHVLRRTTLDLQLGGAETIVRNHVSRALDGLAGEELETTTDLFRNLVTPSGVKVAHTADDLARMTGHLPGTVSAVLDRLYRERILRAVDPAPGASQARYEVFHDRLSTPILDWRDQQENARLDAARQNAELEAQIQRTQARRFKRRARIMLVLAVGLLILLAAVAILLRYAQDQSTTASREKRAALAGTRQATYFGLTTRAQSQLSSRPDIALLLYLAAYQDSRQPVAERNLVATLQALRGSGAVGILHGHTDAVEGIAFSPSGRTLASASGDKTLRLWHVSGSRHGPLGQPLRSDGPLYSVAYAPSGGLLASGGFNKVTVWNLLHRTQKRVIPYPAGAITSVSFSHRHSLLAAGGSNGTVLLWNTTTHRETRLALGSSDPVRSVAFSPAGNVLATSTRGDIVLWDVATHRQLGPRLPGHGVGFLYTVAFSPNGQTLAAAGSKGPIELWNLANTNQSPTRLRGRFPVNSLAFSPDGTTLAAGQASATVLWNLATDRRLTAPLRGQYGAVYGVAFNRTGTMLATAGADRTIALWPNPLRVRFGVPVVRRPDPVTSVAVSSTSPAVAVGDHRGTIVVFDRRTGTRLRVIAAHRGQVDDLAFDPSRGILASAYADGTIGLFDPASGRSLAPPLQGHGGPVFSIAFDHSGTRLVSGGLDTTVRLWDVRHHQQLGRPLQGRIGAVYSVAFRPGDQEIAAAGSGRAIRLWNVRTHAPASPSLIPQNDAVFSLAFSPNGRIMASGGADDTIRPWYLSPGSYHSAPAFTGASNYIRSIAFSPDGQSLASGSTDTTVRFWDVATGTELGAPLTGGARSVESVAFSADGRLLVSGDVDGTVRLWRGIVPPPAFPILRTHVCSYLGAGLSEAEWSEYASGIPYRKTCARGTAS